LYVQRRSRLVKEREDRQTERERRSEREEREMKGGREGGKVNALYGGIELKKSEESE
jgi:hypothetical protein